MQVVPVTLLFSDGVAHRMDVDCGSTLVEAAAASGLTLLTDCSNGKCGTCTGQLCSGEVQLVDYDRAVLPDEDRAAGSILPCVARVTGPCVVELPYEFSEASADVPPPVEGRVTAVQKIADETVRLEVDVDEAMVFEPGQYVRMRPVGTEEWRSYSMANASGSTHLVFYVRLVPGGVFSEWLANDAKAGARLDISMPHGSFFLRDEPRARLFVAGGTGLAPFLSMLESIAADPARQAHPTTLLMGVRTPAHLFAASELESFRQRLPNLVLRFAAESQATDVCSAGYATDLIGTLDLDKSTRVYLCGPPPMVDAGRNAAVTSGMARNDVLCERFA